MLHQYLHIVIEDWQARDKKSAIERAFSERYGFSQGSLHILRMPFGQLLNCMCLEVNGIQQEAKLLFTAH